ncbi:hypothetical protein DPEC_G00281140 [Dallia pectoralis]|uniref:Uncharacterized protein n=1 Tax=Dallia pectoralis TaxID=75939 RepID=A0ACC2FN79_DALPE|nr:hypothetical protein DPEC_G00281140 [Dallia pectoralis]
MSLVLHMPCANANSYYGYYYQGHPPSPLLRPPPSQSNGSFSSPVSTMTSQSSVSSLAKHHQSWLDLVSKASPVAGEAVVCSVQIHTLVVVQSIKRTKNPSF